MTVDIAKLRELLARASPGPWSGKGYGFRCVDGGLGVCHGFQDDSDPASEDARPHNAVLIVAAVNALPQLLDEVERLRPVYEAAKEWLMYKYSEPTSMNDRDAMKAFAEAFGEPITDEVWKRILDVARGAGTDGR